LARFGKENMSDTLRLFIDTEFTDFVNTELISIGIAASNGAEFYGENLDFNSKLSSDFVKANIYPLLTPKSHGMKRTELAARLGCWLDELPCKNFIVTIDYATDWTLMHGLLDEKVHPKMLTVQNVFDEMCAWANKQIEIMNGDPHDWQQMYNRLQNNFAFGIQEYFARTKEIPHHALSDAKANREGYNRLAQEFGMPL
jgi:hypothetical protein